MYILFRMFILHRYSLFIASKSWIEINIEIVFSKIPQQVSLRQLHCDFKYFDWNRWQSQFTMYISYRSAVLGVQ